MSPFVIMTGASGAGKTTIARTIRRLHRDVAVFLEEELERPSDAFMASIGRTEGPGGAFQRGFALFSVPRVAAVRAKGRPVLLDCQCRIAFLQEAISNSQITGARILLVQCNDAARDGRLHGRGSPELANEQMHNWSRYLWREATEAGLDVLDTSAISLDESVARVLAYLQERGVRQEH